MSEKLRLKDGQARELARSSFEHPVVLEAGAGTGKTATLVARVLTWCLGPGWDRAAEDLAIAQGGTGDERITKEEISKRVADRIVAITFTERAAAEMKERIARGLAAVRGGEGIVGLSIEDFEYSPSELGRRAVSMLATLDRFFIGTIHAFCRRLLTQHAIPAGIHPGFIVDADERMSNSLIEDVLASKLQEVYGDPGDEDLLALARMGWGPAEVVEALGELVRKGIPVEALAEDPYSPARVRTAARKLTAPVESLVQKIAAPLAKGKGNLKKSRELCDALGTLATRLPEIGGAGELRELALGVDTGRLKDWAAGKTNKTDAKALGSLVEEVEEAAGPLAASIDHLQSLEPEVLPRAACALGGLLREVHGRLRAEGVETFSALLRDTRDLLARDEVMRAHIRQRFDQLLVDEFQDTDPIQYEIIEYLALDGPSFERPGLFLIGDPKQSIYGWRGADLGAYARFVEQVRQAGGEVHSLQVNFRSVPEILEEVDRMIGAIMEPAEGLQPAFESLLPAEEKQECHLPGTRRPVEYWVSWARPEEGFAKSGPDTSADDARMVEAQLLVRDLLSLRENGVDWQRIAILQRTGTQHEFYLDALRDAGIPFLIEGDRNYYAKREIGDATALVLSVCDRADHVSLLTWLRSSAVGLPDAALLPLWRNGFPGLVTGLVDRRGVEELESCIEAAKKELDSQLPGVDALPEWDVALKDWLRVLAQLRESWVCDETDVFVEKLRGLTLFEETEAARFQGAHRLANLERFFIRLRNALLDSQIDPIVAVRSLRRAIVEQPEEEEAQPGDETLDAIRILTVHKAKGLTFDHVYVMGLHGGLHGRGANTPNCDAGMVDGQWEVRLLGVPSLAYDELVSRRQAVSAAEEVRNLYVAMTRPRLRLVLAGRWPEVPEPLPASMARSRMDLLAARPVGAPDLQALFEAAAEGDVEALDDTGARWVMPGPAEDFGRLKKESAQVPDEKVARVEHALVEEARKEARERMQRGLTGTASGRAKHDEKPSEAGGGVEDALWFPVDATLATIVGKALHQALENFNVENDPAQEFTAQDGALEDYIADATGDHGIRADALVQARAIWSKLRGSALLTKLGEVEIIGRELPLLLAPREGVADEPAGACIGTIDLLYRDPVDGAYVVADHKSDNVSSDEEMAERAAGYRPQGEIYLEAISKGLCRDGDPPPRFELWFLRTGKVVPVSMNGSETNSAPASLKAAPPGNDGGGQGNLF